MQPTQAHSLVHTLQMELLQAIQMLDAPYSHVRHAVLVHHLRDAYQLVRDQMRQSPFERLPSSVICQDRWDQGRVAVQAQLRQLLHLCASTPSPNADFLVQQASGLQIAIYLL